MRSVLLAGVGIQALILSACSGGGGDSAPPGGSSPPPQTSPRIIEKVSGLNFGPYLDGQSPNQGIVISESQLTARMQVVAPMTNSVRTYSMTHGLENAGRVARNLGVGITVGAFLSRDAAQNEREKSGLIAAALAGDTGDVVIAGSEVLERADLAEDALISQIRDVRQALPARIQLGYADTAYQLLAHPDVVDEVDVVFANIYPYFDGVPIEQSMRHFDFIFTRLQTAVHPKKVVVSETGWPTAGAQRGGAIPSATNAASYFDSFVAWARTKQVEYFYFEAFNEAWKTDEGSQGPHWGVLDSSGNMKTGMNAAFDGTNAADTWSRPIPGGAGPAQLQFTSVPVLGSIEDLRGQVTGVDPALYRVAIYIEVDGLWYPRPSYTSPTIYPGIDGMWSADITTASGDEAATRIAGFLLPVAYRVSLAREGSPSVPAELAAAAVASREVER